MVCTNCTHAVSGLVLSRCVCVFCVLHEFSTPAPKQTWTSWTRVNSRAHTERKHGRVPYSVLQHWQTADYMLCKACALSNADTLGWSCSSTLRGESPSRSKSLWFILPSPATTLCSFWSMHSFLCFLSLLSACIRFSVLTFPAYTFAFIRICCHFLLFAQHAS